MFSVSFTHQLQEFSGQPDKKYQRIGDIGNVAVIDAKEDRRCWSYMNFSAATCAVLYAKLRRKKEIKDKDEESNG